MKTFLKLNTTLPKDTFHLTARKAFRELAKAANITDFDLRTNKAGIAVLGETTLHSESVYVQTSQSMGIMVRSVKNKKDYTGGVNHFCPYGMPERLLELVKKLSTKYI